MIRSRLAAKVGMKKLVLAGMVVALGSSLLTAQDWTSKGFASPPDDVYGSAVKVIALHHEIKSKYLESRVVRFHIRGTAWSWAYNACLSVEPQSNGTSLVKAAVERPPYAWSLRAGPDLLSGKNEIRKIFRWMAEDLRTPKTSSP